DLRRPLFLADHHGAAGDDRLRWRKRRIAARERRQREEGDEQENRAAGKGTAVGIGRAARYLPPCGGGRLTRKAREAGGGGQVEEFHAPPSPPLPHKGGGSSLWLAPRKELILPHACAPGRGRRCSVACRSRTRPGCSC